MRHSLISDTLRYKLHIEIYVELEESFACVFDLSPNKTAFCVEATALLFSKLKELYPIVTVMKPCVDKGLNYLGGAILKGSSKPEKLKCNRWSQLPNAAVGYS